eukprot:jgi/Mesvir1/26728/Mv20504-RA.1
MAASAPAEIVGKAADVVAPAIDTTVGAAKKAVKVIGFIRNDGTVRPFFAILVCGVIGFNTFTSSLGLIKTVTKDDTKLKRWGGLAFSLLVSLLSTITMYDVMTRAIKS